MAHSSRSKFEGKVHGPEGSTSAPPPENKVVTTCRIYEDDLELMRRHYPGGISPPIRKLVRRFADRIRRDHGKPPKGMPNE